MEFPSLRAAALAYAARGWPVLPLHSVSSEGQCSCGRADCPSPGKHPRIPRGVHGASTDPEQIIAWWTQWPDANIGLVTGSLSGLVVVDVDPRNGGLESLRSLVHVLPETLTAQTGGQGLHLYYQASTPVRSRKLAPGIDLKGEGGYVVAPPSRHRSGQAYTWLAGTAPVPLPAGVLRRREQPPVLAPDQKEWVVELLSTPCPEGQRNETLTRLAGYFRNLLPEAVTLAILREWNQRCCQPPLPETEVRYTVHHKYVRYAPPATEGTQRWSAASLLLATFPEIPYIVEGLIPVGLTLLAGRPKRGKSYLALQLAHAVATGREILGRPTRPGRVLYLALEDTERRVQRRLRKMELEPTDDLLFEFTCPPLVQGGLDRIVTLLGEGFTLLVVDTLERILSRIDQDAAGPITDTLGPLQLAAHEHGAAILVVDHHRKPGLENADAIDDVLGSTGKTAVADTVLGLYRKSGERLARLHVIGRDVEEQEIHLAFDGLRCLWEVGENPEELSARRHLQAICTFLASAGPSDIYVISQETGLSRSTLVPLLQTLVAQGRVRVSYLSTPHAGRPRAIYALQTTDASTV